MSTDRQAAYLFVFLGSALFCFSAMAVWAAYNSVGREAVLLAWMAITFAVFGGGFVHLAISQFRRESKP